MMNDLDRHVAEAILGVDTLWGGDAMSPSGAGRFIADSWFSDEPLPEAYTQPAAARLRQSGGVSAKAIDREAVSAYLRDVNLRRAIDCLREESARCATLRRSYFSGLALCLDVMLALAMEFLGQVGPSPKDGVLSAVDAWRRDRITPMASVQALGAAVIAKFDALSARNLVPFLPAELAKVPRANITFLPIEDAWFSGSMNYIGRARTANGAPLYEATYEVNASLQITYPEFEQLVSHEVVPGHVTTFAYLQDLYMRGQAGFEATVLTMNTRAATLFEGLANNAILIAHGVNDVNELPDKDLQIGVLLALLQDDAKNQASYMTWGEGRPQQEVAATLRSDYLVTEERAQKLSGAWGRHPLLGRMYLPAYRAGTEKVAHLRRAYPEERVLQAVYGCSGPVDIETVDLVLKGSDLAAQYQAAPGL